MKKITCFVLTLIMALMLVVSVSATTKNEFLAELKSSVPEKYTAIIYNPIESIFNQIEVTDEQSAQLLEWLNDAKKVITVDRGSSLDAYTKEEQEYAVDMFDKACKLLGLTYTMTPEKANSGEVIVSVFKDGVKLGELDGDAVNATNAPEKNMLLPVIAVSMIALCGVTIVASKKQLSK